MNSKTTIVKKLSFLLSVIPSALMAFSGSGAGTDVDPYQVTSLTELQEMKDDLTAHYRLMNDIDASATRTWNLDSTGVYQGFEPIASSGKFTGSIHGGGFTISGLTIKRNVSFVGLIGRGQGVEVDSLGLDGAYIINTKKNSSSVYAGGIVAYGDTINISSSYVTGTVGIDNIESTYSNSSNYAGGIAGQLSNSSVVMSYANVEITARAYAASPFVAYAYSYNSFENNYSHGSISNESSYRGGLFGWLYIPSAAKNNYSTADSLRGYYYLYDGNDVVHSNFYLDSITRNSSVGFSGKTADSLKTISLFTDTSTLGLDSAWDFTGTPNDDNQNNDIWKLGEGYPYLKWMSDSVEINFIAGSNGTISGSAIQKIATGTESSEVTATPNSGYAFLEWSDGNKNPNRIIKNAGVNSSLTAYFATSVSLAYTANSNGTLEGETSQIVAQGTHGKAILAVADSGYFFQGWSDGRIENPRLDSNAQTAISVSAEFGSFSVGEGTVENPYEISTLSELQGMRSFLSSHFILVNNIDASSTNTWTLFNDSTYGGFAPVGGSDEPFTGTFNGKGKTISGLFIDNLQENYTGLFGKIEGVQIDSVHLTGVSVRGGSSSGGIVGTMDSSSSVTNSSVGGDVYGDGSSVGGLVGVNQGLVSRSTSSANVSGDASSFLNVGGVVGVNTGEVSYSSASGYIKGNVSSYHYTGGVVGSNSGKVLYSKFSGTVSAVTGSIIYLGGIVGHNGGVTGFCASSGTIKRESGNNGWSVGGIVGNSYEGSLHNSISSMDIAISGRNVGGVVGNQRSGSVRNVAFVGRFTAGSGQAGVIGTPGGEGFDSDVGNVYWDTTTSGVVLDSNGVGQSTLKMKEQATYVGWDFTDIWSIDEGNGYPELSWDSLDNREHRSVFYRVSSLKGIIEGPGIQWGKPGQATNSVTAVATSDGYRFKKWDDGVKTATRSDFIGEEDKIYYAEFATFSVSKDTSTLTGTKTWRLIDSTFGFRTDTVLTFTDTLLTYNNTVLEKTDTIVGGLVVWDTLMILSGSIDTLETISYDTLEYIPLLRVDSTLISELRKIDSSVVKDSLIQVKEDTVVTSVWYVNDTTTTKTLIDSLHDDVSFSRTIDTLIIGSSVWLKTELDTLKYQALLSSRTYEKKVSSQINRDVDSADVTIELVGEKDKEDTLVTTVTYVLFVDTTWSITDSLADDVLFKSDTIFVKDSIWSIEKSRVVDTLKYIPVLTQTVVVDSVTSKVEGSSYTDTLVVLEGDVGREDTITTQTSYSNYVDTIWTYTDSLSDGSLYAVDTSWTSSGVYLVEDSSKVDTAKYQDVITLLSSEEDLLNYTGELTLRVCDVNGNLVVNQQLNRLGQDNLHWNFLDSNGSRVNNGNYIVVWMFKDEFGNEKMIRSIIAVKD